MRLPLSIAALVLASTSPALAATVHYGVGIRTPGTWSLYAWASDGDNFGIAKYSAVITGATSIDNKTLHLLAGSGPGGLGEAGFSEVRSADNPAVVGMTTLSGAQDTLTPSPNLIRGFGQESNSLAGKGITDVLNPTQTPPSEGNPWNAIYLLATGTRNGNALVSITTGVIDTFATVFNAATGTSVSAATIVQTQGCIDCLSISGGQIGNVVANDPGTVGSTLTASSVYVPGPFTWSGFTFDGYQPAPGASGSGPAVPAAFDPSTQKFSWITVGSPLGRYNWHVTVGDELGVGTGFISVNIIAVPELSTLSLVSIALFGGFGLIRRRRVATRDP